MIMKTVNLPYLALVLCLMLTLLITKGSELGSDGQTLLPLLTLLIVNEGAFFLAIAGAFVGVRQLKSAGVKASDNWFYTITTVICVLLSVQFMLLGVKLWPL